jgi:hypothetical protein
MLGHYTTPPSLLMVARCIPLCQRLFAGEASNAKLFAANCMQQQAGGMSRKFGPECGAIRACSAAYATIFIMTDD